MPTEEPPPPARGAVAVHVRGAAAGAAVRAAVPAGATVLGGALSDADAARAAAPADLVILDSDIRVEAGWLGALRAAAGDDGTVATVDAVVLADVPVGGAQRVRDGARAHQAAPAWRCTLVTRAALDIAGPLDAGFAERCTTLGLLHVLAGGAVVSAPHEDPPPTDEPELHARTRWRARQLAGKLSVTIDARILRDAIAGTQVHTLELLAALHRTDALRLRALLPPELHPTAATLLDGLDELERLDASTLDTSTPATAVVHRPYQVSSAIDLATLRQLGTRLVITHQDLLNYHNPAYHVDLETWTAHRELTVAALRGAHGVVTFSGHAAADLRAEELVQSDQLRVVPIGVDHTLASLAARPREPAVAAALGGAPYLLCLGTDLRHKNRPFAIALLHALRERHAWRGKLVLAGPHAPVGSSERAEAELLAADPELAAHVLDAGVPDEAEKAWLYAHATAAVYPTLYEGFGLVPFEAADHGTPCLFAAQAALVETLAPAARIVPWDAQASADRAIAVLAPSAERDRLVETVRAAAGPLTWDRAAAGLIAAYEDALSQPADRHRLEHLAEAERGHWEGSYWALRNEVGPTGLALVGAEPLLPEDAQRTLAALARRPATRRPLLALLGALRRLPGRE